MNEPASYIQVDSDLWIVMREDKHRPKAVIKRITGWDGIEQYLLMTWHSDPAERKLVRMYDALEDADRSVKWLNPKPETPKMPDFLQQRNPQEGKNTKA